MGSLGDNGSGWPPDGGRSDGLPDLPPEWGDIVVPDDLSALSAEVAAVQAELHRQQDRTVWRRLARKITDRPVRRPRAGALRGPALIIAMAVLVTLASLWASAWPGPARPAASRSTSGSDNRNLPALELIDEDEQHVPLRAQLPAVILLIDGCDCTQLVTDTAAAVGPEIAVITVVTDPTAGAPASVSPMETVGPVAPTPGTLPAPAPGLNAVQALRDPIGELRSAFNLAAPDGNAAVLVVSRTGEVVQAKPGTDSIEDIRSDLARI